VAKEAAEPSASTEAQRPPPLLSLAFGRVGMARDDVECALATAIDAESRVGLRWWPGAVMAPVAFRRWSSFARRHPKAKRPTTDERVLDLAKGLQAHFGRLSLRRLATVMGCRIVPPVGPSKRATARGVAIVVPVALGRSGADRCADRFNRVGHEPDRDEVSPCRSALIEPVSGFAVHRWTSLTTGHYQNRNPVVPGFPAILVGERLRLQNR
jgi:hypothetical protein